MSSANERACSGSRNWLSHWTAFDNILESACDEPAEGFRAWARTTAGIVVMLLLVQFTTGVLLAFYYVPSADHAHATVAYIEKVLPAGSWIRALHHYGSQWLTLFLFIHIIQLFWSGSYRARPVAWISSVLFLALILAAGATGYSLPWDARAFFSTRIAEGIGGGLPWIGGTARTWLLGGNEITTLTLSRFFALHVIVIPAAILTIIVARLFVFRDHSSSEPISPGLRVSLSRRPGYVQFTRYAIVSGLVFLGLALYAKRFPAPLGPSVASLTLDYLPRPGAQFVWLYQLLKYVPGRVGSLVAVVFPGLIFFGLAILPFLKAHRELPARPGRTMGVALLSVVVILVTTMTSASYLEDRRDPRTRQQLARQAAEEAAFRKNSFVPSLLQADQESPPSVAPSPGVLASPSFAPSSGPPSSYTKLCATCHGEHGEGARQGPLRFPPLLGVSAKPRRTVDDIVGILNDPKAYGLEPPMKSFAAKLTDEEKRQIAEWVVTLRK
jgi:ubiquinol-cytochrome c reductase cytochrome b subunit